MKKWTDDTKLSQEARDKKIIQYTTPKIKYKYRRISWDSYIRNESDGYKCERSSIIPVTTINDETYWLLGSFHDYPRQIVMDFGGSCVLHEGNERNRQSPFGCAITEVHEESKGLLTQIILKNIGILDKELFHIYVGEYRKEKRKEKVNFFFVPVDYNEARDFVELFNKTPDIDEKLGPVDFYLEKDILAGKILTTSHLTDFVNFLKR